MTFSHSGAKKFLFILAAVLVCATLALAGWTAIGVRRIEADHPAAGRFVSVDGVRLHYTDHGVGPPILLIHGASSNLLEFEASLVPWLSHSHRVLNFDRPGHGYSERGSEAWPDPARTADLLVSASEMLGAPRPLLVGHSWGGAVVMTALVREQTRVAGGVLLAGVAGHWVGERSFTERLGDWPALEWLFSHTLVYPVGSKLVPDALSSVFEPQSVPEGQDARVGAALALRPANYRHNVEDLSRLSVFLQRESTRYGEIAGPLLAIHGSADTVVPFWNHGRRLQPVVEHFEATLLADIGHAPHHVVPKRVASLVSAFYRRVR